MATDDLITITEAAERMRIPIPTAYVWSKSGIIPTTRVAGRRLAIASLLPRVRVVNRRRVFIEFPDGFEDADRVLEENPQLELMKG